MQLIVILLLFTAIVLTTVVFGKVVGPKVIVWLLPIFNKVTDKLDNAIVTDEDEWDEQVQGIINKTPGQLMERAWKIVSNYAEKYPDRSQEAQLPNGLPPSVTQFFNVYCRLSFDKQVQVLNASILRVVEFKGFQYLIIGSDEGEGQYFATPINGDASVVRLSISDSNNLIALEDDSPSFEHFITLQYELQLLSSDKI